MTGHDAVVQLAALDYAVDATEQQFFETNVQDLWNVLEAAEAAGVGRTVVCSSIAALGLSAENPPHYLPVDREHPAAPVDAYSLSKQVGEVIAQGFAWRGTMEVRCLRPGLVMQSGIAYDVAVKAAASDGAAPPPVAIDPSWRVLPEAIGGSRAFVSPVDAGRCFRAALEAEGRSFDIYHVTVADTFSPLATLEIVGREYHAAPEIRHAALFDADPRASIYNFSRTCEMLNWEPRERWSDLLGRVIAEAKV